MDHFIENIRLFGRYVFPCFLFIFIHALPKVLIYLIDWEIAFSWIKINLENLNQTIDERPQKFLRYLVRPTCMHIAEYQEIFKFCEGEPTKLIPSGYMVPKWSGYPVVLPT